MPETYENWLGLINSCANYAHKTREIYQVLPYSVDFKAPRELWNPLCKSVLSKYRSISYIGLLNFLNKRKARK